MRNFATRIRLACIVVLMPTVVAFGQQTANPETNVQNAITYNDLGLAKEKKGDLNGALGGPMAVKFRIRFRFGVGLDSLLSEFPKETSGERISRIRTIKVRQAVSM
jgi:hypothetical protein